MEIWEPTPPATLWASPGLLRDSFTFTFLLFYWHYNPLWVLVFSVIFFHSALSLHNFLHPLITIICISSSTSSIHLFFGLPPFLLPVGFHSFRYSCSFHPHHMTQPTHSFAFYKSHYICVIRLFNS